MLLPVRVLLLPVLVPLPLPVPVLVTRRHGESGDVSGELHAQVTQPPVLAQAQAAPVPGLVLVLVPVPVPVLALALALGLVPVLVPALVPVLVPVLVLVPVPVPLLPVPVLVPVLVLVTRRHGGSGDASGELHAQHWAVMQPPPPQLAQATGCVQRPAQQV